MATVWGEVSLAVWCIVLLLPASLPATWERRQISWGLMSVFVLEYFIMFIDPGFKVRTSVAVCPRKQQQQQNPHAGLVYGV